MKIDIKKTTKPIKYNVAIKLLEKRLTKVNQNKSKELIWILEHPSVFTAGKMYKKDEILDHNVRLIVIYVLLVMFKLNEPSHSIL